MVPSLRPIPFVVVFSALFALVAQAQSKPYALSDITDLLKADVSSGRVLRLVEKSCISFRLTAEAAGELSVAGGDDVLIAALRSVCFHDSAQRIVPDPLRPKPKVLPAVKVIPARSLATVKYYRYRLDMMSGDPLYSGQLGSPPSNGRYFEVSTDRVGRPERVRTIVRRDTTREITHHYQGSHTLADSLWHVEQGEAPSIRIERDASGNRIRETYRTFAGEPRGARRFVRQGGQVIIYDSTVAGAQSSRHVITYFTTGIKKSEVVTRSSLPGSRVEYTYSEEIGDWTEARDFNADTLAFITKATFRANGLPLRDDIYYANGSWVGSKEYDEQRLATLERYKWPNGQAQEKRYAYDEKRRLKEILFSRDGKLILTFVYDRKPNGELNRTLAVGPDGQLMAEYPDLLVESVTQNGRPVGAPDKGTIYKTTAWW